MKNKEIESRDDVDEHKAQVIKDEIIVGNAYSHCSVPMISDGWKPDDSYIGYSAPVLVSQTLEKPFITKGTNKSMGNFGNCLVTTLNYPTNYLYSNIDHLKSPYDIKLVQSIKVYTHKKFSKTCLFKVVFDYGENTYDLDKVVKL